MFDGDSKSQRALRRRSLLNLSRMGHCAPTILQTVLDVSALEAQWLVRATAGLPGGIGNTGGECGGVTAPLLLLGLRQPATGDRRRLPLVVYQGHALLARFRACQGTLSCRDIRGDARVPLRCIGVIQQAAQACGEALSCTGVLSAEQEEAYGRLHASWVEQGFHCAHAVFRELPAPLADEKALHEATSGFLGGTVFTGMTCSALTAGVMALGLALGTIENSRMRVLRMIGTMAVGGDAFADELNAFNPIMNLGHELAEWFTAEFGSTQCRALTQCDFSTSAGVQRYLQQDGTARCRTIAARVAQRTEEMIRAKRPSGPAIHQPSPDERSCLRTDVAAEASALGNVD